MAQIKSHAFTSDDLTKIIKACGETGVAEIKIGEIEIKFTPYFQTTPKVSYSVEAQAQELPSSTPEANPTKPTTPPIEDEDYDLFMNPTKWDLHARGTQGDDLP